MVRLLSKSQQLVTGVMFPRGVYSRVVSCAVQALAAGPAECSYTPVVGQSVWLLGIKVTGFPAAPTGANQTTFYLLTGTTLPASAAAILEWENILPVFMGGTAGLPWVKHDGVTEMSWEMNQHFSGTGRRFGIWAQRGPVGLDELIVSFRISEG